MGAGWEPEIEDRRQREAQPRATCKSSQQSVGSSQPDKTKDQEIEGRAVSALFLFGLAGLEFGPERRIVKL